MAERAEAVPSDQVVPEVSFPNRPKVMGSEHHTENMADTDCAKVLVELIAVSQVPTTVECAESFTSLVSDARLPAPVAGSEICLIPPKSLKRACPTVVYQRRKQKLVQAEFTAPTTIKLAERLRYNFSRSLSLEESSTPERARAGQVIRYLPKTPVERAERDINDLCEEPSFPPKQSD
ncbi:hypothetical protein KC19_11G162500 [Ceratodon purpureus]|uniref:Uncharacterized protein n=1 Tax=Ceratodon purpureus TaxID=3225 RepID=A0A8T0GHV1_CERPU|nr:hypothetical protein KC19_11G162500 [Ceratodon purpureus]